MNSYARRAPSARLRGRARTRTNHRAFPSPALAPICAGMAYPEQPWPTGTCEQLEPLVQRVLALASSQEVLDLRAMTEIGVPGGKGIPAGG